MPPLPVARNRPFQCSGNQASKTILDCMDVLIVNPMRQKSTEVTWTFRLHVVLLSVNVKVVFEETNWRILSVAPGEVLSGWRSWHLCSKPYRHVAPGWIIDISKYNKIRAIILHEYVFSDHSKVQFTIYASVSSCFLAFAPARRSEECGTWTTVSLPK